MYKFVEKFVGKIFMCFEVVLLVINKISFIKVEVMILCVVDFEMLEQLYYTR